MTSSRSPTGRSIIDFCYKYTFFSAGKAAIVACFFFFYSSIFFVVALHPVVYRHFSLLCAAPDLWPRPGKREGEGDQYFTGFIVEEKYVKSWT